MSPKENNYNLNLPSFDDIENDDDNEDEKNVSRTLSDSINISDAAKQTSKLDIDSNNLLEMRQQFKTYVSQEVNQNRKLYRAQISQSLYEQDEKWDEGLSEVNKINYLDDLIDKTMEIWIDIHLDTFIQEINRHNDEIDISEFIPTSSRVLQAISGSILITIAKDIVDKLSSNAVDYLFNQTSIGVEELTSVIVTLLRAMFGI